MSDWTMNDVLRILGTPDAVPESAVEVHRILSGIRKSKKVKDGTRHTCEFTSALLTIKEIMGAAPNTHRAVLIVWDDRVVNDALDAEVPR